MNTFKAHLRVEQPQAQATDGMNTETDAQAKVLEPEALVRVLQHVPVKERLDACARVCSAWCAAASVATKKIELLGCTQRKCSMLQPWLSSCADAVDSITISARFDSRILAADAWVNTPDSTWRMPELQLPYKQLGNSLTKLSLKLIKCPLAAAAASGVNNPAGVNCSSKAGAGGPFSSASLADLTALRELSVTDCVIQLHGLPALTALERLELSQGWGAPQGGISRGTAGAGACGPMSPAMSAMTAAAGSGSVPAAFSSISGDIAGVALPNLTRLTHLSLSGSCCCAEAFGHVQHLEHLQELVLGWGEQPQPVVAGSEAWSLSITLDDSTMPGLSKLTRLQKLVVAGAVEAVDPALLQGLPATLQHLQLDDCRLVMTLGQPRLAILAAFKQLRHLSINNKRGPLSFLSAEDCMALTASSKLTYLGLTGCQMPADGCSKMFGAEGQLPFLQKLEAAPSILSDPAAVALLSICCPKLESLIIQLPTATTQKPVGPINLSGLQQVSGLKTLVLTGVTVSGSSGFRALGELTELEELVISAIRGFRLADVMLLTSCKQLRYLKLMHMQLTDVLAASLCLTHQGHEDRPPNVWAQLPPALLKQALWLYPFRSLPTSDDLQQVTELINAQQMHYLVEPCGSGSLNPDLNAALPSSSSAVGALQQQVISLALALLQLQQQRKALAAAAGGGGHPLLQQLQQQTQGMRDLLMKRIADHQECIKNPQHIQRLQQQQQGTPNSNNPTAGGVAGGQPPRADILSMGGGVAVSGMGGARAGGAVGGGLVGGCNLSGGGAGGGLMLGGEPNNNNQLLMAAAAAGMGVGSAGMSPLFLQQQHQQQMQLRQVLDATQAAGLMGGLGGGIGGGIGSIAQLLLHPQQQQQGQQQSMGYPVSGLGCGGLHSALPTAAMATSGLMPQVLQQQHLPKVCMPQMNLPGSVAVSTAAAADAATTAVGLLPMLQQQQNQLSQGAAAAASSLSQLLVPQNTNNNTNNGNQGLSLHHDRPPGLSGAGVSAGGPPPGLSSPHGLGTPRTHRGRGSGGNTNRDLQGKQQNQHQQRQHNQQQRQQQQQQGAAAAAASAAAAQANSNTCAYNNTSDIAHLLALQQQWGGLQPGMLAQFEQQQQQQQQQQQAYMLAAHDLAAQLQANQQQQQLNLLQLQQHFQPHTPQQQQQQQLQQLMQLQALAGLQNGLGGLTL